MARRGEGGSWPYARKSVTNYSRQQRPYDAVQPAPRIQLSTEGDLVELAFQTLQLRKRCEEPDKSFTNATPHVIEQLKHRLADLRAANSPVELLAGSPQLIDSKPPTVRIQLGDG